MRFLIVSTTTARAGGIESYLELLLPALISHGHEARLVTQAGSAPDRPGIALPPDVRVERIDPERATAAVNRLTDWRPDIVYVHGRLDLRLEKALASMAPAVYFAHNYYGVCISGLKTRRRPQIEPCNRKFGASCLLQYFPRGCGGRNPATMISLYRREADWLDQARRYKAILTHSERLRTEYLHHGFDICQVRVVPFAVYSESEAPRAASPTAMRPSELRLLYSGRMEPVKGVDVFLDSLPAVRRALGRPIRATLAGAGAQEPELCRKAAFLQADSGIRIEFLGWKSREDLESLYAASDLLVVPSLWPEPFGMVGPEAGRYGLPAVAFPVGGIGSWLEDGQNGLFAQLPLGASSLAAAISDAVGDERVHARLREGARRLSGRFSVENHLRALLPICDQIVSRPN